MIFLGKKPLTWSAIKKIIHNNEPVALDPDSRAELALVHHAVREQASSDVPQYGINTGFGALAELRISHTEQELLQRNIILSHAIGVGEPMDFPTAKTLMLLRLNTLAQGFSGASLELLDNLVALINANCAPFVPRKGSVGASGDLAPLAHLGLLLLGLENALIDGRLVTAHDALRHAGISSMVLKVRDGLAIVNGTQAIVATAVSILGECHHLARLADAALTSTLEALGGLETPFDERIHKLKPHPGQGLSAARVQAARQKSTARKYIRNTLTQDPYSLRCAPQVHGACLDTIRHVQNVTEIELNAVTDNPLIFINKPSMDVEILSGGNFHGQRMAFALDYLALAIAEFANIAERRIELLLNNTHSRGLPAFLIDSSGINSGYMIMQTTAAALVNENKMLCHPASIDNIPTCASREDHVSMGMTSANKLWPILENTYVVLAMELPSPPGTRSTR